MSKTDRIKEELGWLKVAFGVAAAVCASLIGWLAQQYGSVSLPLFITGIVTTGLVAVLIVFINKRVYKRLDELEDL
ncbi:MAG: hypothetical protein QM533_03030 [Cytophagales bacterium]|nr:hypothetical protein [Cytophagales bacterium]